MRLLELERRLWSVAVVADGENDTSSVLGFLQDQPANYRSSAKGFRALFKRFSEHGRQGLTVELFHEASKPEAIWEFVKGDLRVYCFMDGDERLVILSHGIIKKRQNAHHQDVERAVALRNKYLEAKRANTVERVKYEQAD